MKDKKNVDNQRQCRLEECSNKLYARGYCRKHYERNLRHNNPFFTVKKRGIYKKCIAEECNRAHYCKGYCAMHYKRYHKYGNHTIVYLNHPSRYRTIGCIVHGCDNSHNSFGFCSKHYQRLRNRSVLWYDERDELFLKMKAEVFLTHSPVKNKYLKKRRIGISEY